MECWSSCTVVAAQGPARLTIEDPKEQLLLNRYVTHIRPQIRGGGGLSLLRLPIPEGRNRRVDKLGPLFEKITKRYKVQVRTATQVRKSFATRVARECSEVQRRAVAKNTCLIVPRHPLGTMRTQTPEKGRQTWPNFWPRRRSQRNRIAARNNHAGITPKTRR